MRLRTTNWDPVHPRPWYKYAGSVRVTGGQHKSLCAATFPSVVHMIVMDPQEPQPQSDPPPPPAYVDPTAAADPPAAAPTGGFLARHSTKRFDDPEAGGRKYLPQINEWAQGCIEWRCDRSGGLEHMPLWDAYPVWRDEPLPMFNATGPSKQAAKEASARLMAQSGHC
ncbi:hypothetical protein PsYK624_022920 [Phanerochaete sordida]|uniref:Uncharacterized protein n=1 Tax=Phanerochaete sordida TaxID=48140 RepID=A0A9P3FZN7_9APHY|nr:hypothetical protein PsYK624_022920 [Phanerochaete sordida]